MPSDGINNILIVGGGTAGWLTAAYLSQELGTYHEDGVKITLIESSDIETIGVGEGTFPSLRRTLDIIGIKEVDFIRESDATFKQAIKFVNWQKTETAAPHSYLHLFEEPHLINRNTDIAPYWCLMDKNTRRPFAEMVSVQGKIVEADKAPKRLQDVQYQGALNYAYHLDAGKFAQQLKKRALFARVKHEIGEICDVDTNASGDITQVMLKDGRKIAADFYIDCTGFASVLIEKNLGSKWTDISDVLFVNSALTTHLPYPNPNTPIPSSTICTAHTAGWIWDIGLRARRGIGFVYSDTHMDENEARKEFKKYLDQQDGPTNELKIRKVGMRTGYRKKAWENNCVAIGLSGGFLEPLEATGIALTEASLRMFCDLFPRQGTQNVARKRFNRNMEALYENAISFIKLHYCLSERDDSKFWRDNRDETNYPEMLKDFLTLWQHACPKTNDFEYWQKTFGADSFQYILYGMRPENGLHHHKSAYPFHKHAAIEFEKIKNATPQAMSFLPSHRDLIEAINRL